MTGELFRDRGGRPLRIAGALMDVSERRRAQGELVRQSRVFEGLADAVVVVGSVRVGSRIRFLPGVFGVSAGARPRVR